MRKNIVIEDKKEKELIKELEKRLKDSEWRAPGIFYQLRRIDKYTRFISNRWIARIWVSNI